MPQIISLPRFSPDSTPFDPSATDHVLNLLPKPNGWGRMPSFVPVSEALAAAPRGLVIARNDDEVFRAFAGTQSGLYRLNTSANPYTWDDFTNSSGAYNVPADDSWSWAQFGNYLLATQLGDKLQQLDLTTDTEFSDVTDAPKARYIKIVGSFVVLLNLDDAPRTVQWSSYENHEAWDNGIALADSQTFPDGDEIMGAVLDPATGGLIIIQRDAMRRMVFSGSSTYVFSFSPISGARGALAPQSIVEVGNGRFFYLSREGFYEGWQAIPIGDQDVNDWFYDRADSRYLYTVKGMQDPFRTIVWWNYRKTDGEHEIIGYDWSLRRWCYSDENIEQTAALVTPGLTWDGLDDLFDTLDEVTIPYDSRFFKGGSPTWAAFDSDYKLAYATGGNKAAEITTNRLELSPGKRVMVNGARLIGNSSNHTLSVGRADTHAGTINYKAAVSPSSRTDFMSVRADGRVHRFKLAIAANEAWTDWNALQVDYTESGRS